MTILDEPLANFGLTAQEENKDLLSYYWFDSAFSPVDCSQIIEQAQSFPQEGATVFGESDKAEPASDEIRKSTLRWMTITEETRWIFENIQNFFVEANATLFKTDLTGFGESIQYTEYEGKGTHYGWHPDIGPGKNLRKLSVVVQLSDPSDYEGGELEINSGNIMTAPKNQGAVIIFTSILLHRVKPLITGNRYSLVSWVSGPAWR